MESERTPAERPNASDCCSRARVASWTSRDCSSNTEYFGLMSTIELFCSHFRSIGESNVAEVRLHAQLHLSGQSPTTPGQTWDRPELSRFYRQGLTSS